MFQITQDEFVLTPLRPIGPNGYYQAVGLICDLPSNLTKRIYPLQEVKTACERLQGNINNDGLLGTLDSPETLEILLDKVSHKISEITISDDKLVYVTIKPLSTPMGIVLKTLLEAKVELYYSMFGIGNVSENGTVSNLEIISFNMTGSPRHAHA